MRLVKFQDTYVNLDNVQKINAYPTPGIDFTLVEFVFPGYVSASVQLSNLDFQCFMKHYLLFDYTAPRNPGEDEINV